MICDVCGGRSVPSVCDWTFRCSECGLWQSSLVPAIDSDDSALSEEDRRKALEQLRLAQVELTLDRLSRLRTLHSARLLDVGCAYGWFLEAAVSRGMVGVGVEPDATTAGAARARGLHVIHGYFPDCLAGAEAFDIVVFNDVLEHIPNVHAMIAACSGILTSEGLLVLSVPTSTGTLFRLALGMARVGYQGPWRRLWQKSFPSPHVYYFNRMNLDRALQAHGFSRVDATETMTFHPTGLWSRMRFNPRSSRVLNLALYLGLLAAYPVYRTLGRADTELLIYRRNDDRAD